jgi:hypothetical protein
MISERQDSEAAVTLLNGWVTLEMRDTLLRENGGEGERGEGELAMWRGISELQETGSATSERSGKPLVALPSTLLHSANPHAER